MLSRLSIILLLMIGLMAGSDYCALISLEASDVPTNCCSATHEGETSDTQTSDILPDCSATCILCSATAETPPGTALTQAVSVHASYPRLLVKPYRQPLSEIDHPPCWIA